MVAKASAVDTRPNHTAQKLPTKAAHAVRVIAKQAAKDNKEALKRLLRAQQAGDAATVTAAAWEMFERNEFVWDAAVLLLANEYADMDEVLMAMKKWEDERKAGTK